MTVHGDVNPNGATTTWHFEDGLSTSTTYGAKTAGRDAGNGTTAVAVARTLTGLSPATSYRYRLVGSNSVGATFGVDGIFNTSAAPSVVTGAASHLTATAGTLNAVINPQALATNWYFEYGTTTKYGSKTPTNTLAASPNSANVSAGISGLVATTTYHFRVVATSTAGTTVGADATLITGLPVTLNASLSTVIYGGFVTLSGAVASGRSGIHVTIESQAYAQPAFTGLASVTTGAGGVWSYPAQPTMFTTYKAIAAGGTSSPIIVSVRPAVSLRTVAAGRLSTQVVGAVSFASHILQLQRLSKGLWVTWKSVLLNRSAKATFSTSLPVGHTAIRMAIGPLVLGVNQAATGYLAGFSSSVNYLRKK